MLSRNVLVTGASRGLGLELVKQLVKNPENQPNRSPAKVIATCRNPGNADELMELASEEKDRLFVKALDVLDYDSFPDFVNNDIKVCSALCNDIIAIKLEKITHARFNFNILANCAR